MAIPLRSADGGTPWRIAAAALLVAVGCQSPALPPAGSPVFLPATAQSGDLTAVSLPLLGGTASGRTAAALPSPLTAEEAARKAADAERKRDAACVDLYAWAALQCWPALHTPGIPEKKREQVWNLYHDSLKKLIDMGLKFQRLDLQQGFAVRTPSGTEARIAVARNGFAWREEDFNTVQPVRDVDRKPLKHYYQEPGLGVPLIVTRRRPDGRDFLGPVMPFAATALLRPAAPRGLDPADGPAGRYAPPMTQGDIIGVFDLYDPLHVAQVSFGAASQPLARDISAPLALAAEEVKRENWQQLFRPGKTDAGGGLRMLEPYQRGKVPVVFVHGLASDRFTWIQMVNELRTVPWINARCQIWTFQYATGQPFLVSGAEMRQDLRNVAAAFDPQGSDKALANTVLVGHSMGGLVSKLQITRSGNILWEQIASRPFNEVNMQPQDREHIYSLFFFEPLPGVQRVVFIGTPHQGSFWAINVWGRLGSSLVKMPQERVQALNSLLQNNPDVFAKLLRKGIPTSIDLLKPDSPVLIGMQQIPVNPRVKLHSIIGTGSPFSDGTPADGVVPVSSARHPGAVSERLVSAAHSDLPDHPDAIAEVVRILGEHLRDCDAAQQGAR